MRTTGAARCLARDLSAVEGRARSVVALNDPVAYLRNHALVLTRLANSLYTLTTLMVLW